MNKVAIDYSKVYFVGAGPGDCELITLKGYRILAAADVVIYAGSLINHDLLHYCKEGVICHDSASLNLAEIINLMQLGVAQGKLVVRLQTGDLSLYGSIREQAEELTKLGIGYVSVPGVSSFLGAASQLGVEYTVPEVSQSLIITRIAGRTGTPAGESLQSFATHQTSMAIFLSVQDITQVVSDLYNDGKGYPMDTPIVVIYKATWPDERKVEGTLGNIVQKVKEADIKKTALILVGRFLGEEFHYSKLYDEHFSHEYRQA